MSLSAPPLTVALLTYNRLHYLKETVAAILGQSYRDFEFLILDNCSTDGTAAFILGLQDPRIRYVRNAANISSVEFNSRSAYHIALGHRVIVTHDDDIMEADMLERQMRFLDEHPQVRLVWTRVSDMDQDGRRIDTPAGAGTDRLFAPGEYITSFLRERLWPMPSGVMLERTLLPAFYSVQACLRGKAALRKPLDAAGIEDVLMPARINRRHAVGYIHAPLLRRRVHTNQFTHVASLSRPGIHLYRDLKKIARGMPGMQAQALHFDMFVARFDVQETITTHEAPRIRRGTAAKVGDLARQLKAHIATAPDAFLAGLPILLLARLIAPDAPPIDRAALDALDVSAHGSATRAFVAWTRQAEDAARSGVFASLAGRRIVIFGSAFVAALLILEGRRNGDTVVACVDSNINRQGRRLLGVPIEPVAWMGDQVTARDVIVISSERDHEHYIESIIRQSIQVPATIVSWKHLIE